MMTWWVCKWNWEVMHLEAETADQAEQAFREYMAVPPEAEIVVERRRDGVPASPAHECEDYGTRCPVCDQVCTSWVARVGREPVCTSCYLEGCRSRCE
jgi:hypothetical protein